MHESIGAFSYQDSGPRWASRGAFGWFTAGWIGRLAPGLAIYLNRQETQPIELTVAPALYSNERLAVERGVQMSREQAAALVAEVFTEGRASAAPLARHALDCLSWMIATDTLRLRIAVPTPESNYHPKLCSSTMVRTRCSHAGPETPPAEAWRLESSISTSTYRGFRRALAGLSPASPCSTTGLRGTVQE